MTVRQIAAVFFALILIPGVAVAQNSGTQAEQDACTPDVFSLCEDFIPNEGPIVACLQAKRRQLSPPCALVMFPAKGPATGLAKGQAARLAKRRHRQKAH